MRAKIKFNGKEIPDSLCIVDSASNIVTLQTPVTGEEKIDMETHAVEVNIYGELPAFLESSFYMLLEELG